MGSHDMILDEKDHSDSCGEDILGEKREGDYLDNILFPMYSHPLLHSRNRIHVD